MFSARGPFGPSPSEKETRCPFLSCSKFTPSSADEWKKMSLPELVSMNPKPRSVRRLIVPSDTCLVPPGAAHPTRFLYNRSLQARLYAASCPEASSQHDAIRDKAAARAGQICANSHFPARNMHCSAATALKGPWDGIRERMARRRSARHAALRLAASGCPTTDAGACASGGSLAGTADASGEVPHHFGASRIARACLRRCG